jgi:hypothetical protein
MRTNNARLSYGLSGLSLRAASTTWRMASATNVG